MFIAQTVVFLFFSKSFGDCHFSIGIIVEIM